MSQLEGTDERALVVGGIAFLIDETFGELGARCTLGNPFSCHSAPKIKYSTKTTIIVNVPVTNNVQLQVGVASRISKV